MALVAYSDESDLSDVEETDSNLVVKQSLSKSTTNVTNENSAFTGIESIEDDDDFITTNSSNYEEVYADDNSSVRSLLASIPAAATLQDGKPQFEIKADDIVDDVPTVKSWHINEHTRVDVAIEHGASTSKKKPTKRKFILPALSEFQNDEDDIEVQENKKIKPSTSGCGLMSLLPPVKKAPTRINSFVPDSVKKMSKSVPKAKPKKAVAEEDSDNEEELNGCDFFSFEESKILPADIAKVSSTVGPTSEIAPVEGGPVPAARISNVNQYSNFDSSDPQSHDISSRPVQGPSKPNVGVDKTELIKLAGRRNQNEIVNIIDVCADDALMTCDEWMIKSLTEEKPRHSFSKKRTDGPSQQSKRKHQITYLAHQAKERELELQNSWASARLTKRETQAKYGF